MRDSVRLRAALRLSLPTAFLSLFIFSPILGLARSAQEQPARPAPRQSAAVAPPDVAAPPPDAEKTASGLAFRILQPGTGTAHPGPADVVTVHYTGWTTDGKLFDSSILRGRPSTFQLSRVIPGWSEGVQLMVVGERRRFWIPEELTYKGAEGKPKGMLVFDIELLGITPAPSTPPDVAGPPPDAEKSRSGLAWKILRPGKGTRRPSRTSTVRVHYSGWTTDGKLFDSSVVRGQPASFRLDQVIPGWTEGVQMMVEGEVRRLWIPERLAYQGREGVPKGMLVFDVELIAIEDK